MYIAILACLFAAVEAESPTVEDILGAWEQGCDSLRSYDVYLAAKNTTLLGPRSKGWKPLDKPLVVEGVSREIFSEGKRRVEPGVTGPKQGSGVVLIWDGETAKSYAPQAKRLMLESELVVIAPNGPPQLDYESLRRRATGTLDRIKIMRERPGTKLERQEGTHFVLSTPPTSEPFDFSPYGIRVWLDASRNFMPTRIQHLLEESGEEVVATEWENTLAEVGPNVWAVASSLVSGYAPVKSEKANPLKTFTTEVSVNMAISKFNPAISDSVFTIDIPIGTMVSDSITGKRYVFGKANDPAAHLSELVLKGKAAVEQLKSAGASASQGQRSIRPSRGMTVLIANGVTLALLVTVYMYRRLSAKKSGDVTQGDRDR